MTGGISERIRMVKERRNYMGKSVDYYFYRQDSKRNLFLKKVIQTSPSITFYTRSMLNLNFVSSSILLLMFMGSRIKGGRLLN